METIEGGTSRLAWARDWLAWLLGLHSPFFSYAVMLVVSASSTREESEQRARRSFAFASRSLALVGLSDTGNSSIIQLPRAESRSEMPPRPIVHVLRKRESKAKRATL